MALFPNADQVNPTRALRLYATGAITGLCIAGYGLFTAAGTSTRTVPPENIATVNQRPILRSDFIAQLAMETGETLGDSSRAEQLKVLDEMVREELLVQRALELDFGETDQNSRNALVSSISDQAIAEVTTSQPSEQQIRDYFQQHPGKWATEGTMSLRDYTATDLASAHQLAQQLRAGTPAEQLAARHALKESSHQVDEYYFALQFRLGAPLFEAIRGLSAGDVAEPVALPDGIHVVQVEMNTPPRPYTFEQARAQIGSDYNAEARDKRLANTVAFLRSRAKILIAPDYASDFKP
jgi:parvulin-like peptidyl-prolyl isomerase